MAQQQRRRQQVSRLIVDSSVLSITFQLPSQVLSAKYDKLFPPPPPSSRIPWLWLFLPGSRCSDCIQQRAHFELTLTEALFLCLTSIKFIFAEQAHGLLVWAISQSGKQVHGHPSQTTTVTGIRPPVPARMRPHTSLCSPGMR